MSNSPDFDELRRVIRMTIREIEGPRYMEDVTSRVAAEIMKRYELKEKT